MKEPSPEQYSEILRELHNLKGISRISALDAIQTLCESIYRLAKNCQYPPQKEVYELSMEGLQLVEVMIPLDDVDDSKSSELCRRISDLLALQDSES
jgi:HPt (histidine-containing phosphotransfer) domain-containing protein